MRERDGDDLDLYETWANPLLQPDKRFMALAGTALPVLIERAGGFVRFTLEEFEAVQGRYGGKVSVMLERAPDGVFTATLAPSKKARDPVMGLTVTTRRRLRCALLWQRISASRHRSEWLEPRRSKAGLRARTSAGLAIFIRRPVAFIQSTPDVPPRAQVGCGRPIIRGNERLRTCHAMANASTSSSW